MISCSISQFQIRIADACEVHDGQGREIFQVFQIVSDFLGHGQGLHIKNRIRDCNVVKCIQGFLTYTVGTALFVPKIPFSLFLHFIRAFGGI